MSSPRTPKGKKPAYFADPATDKLLQMVITLAGELSVTRDRLDLLERMTTQPGALEAMPLSGDEVTERDASRADFVARVLRVLNQDLEEITNPDARGFDEMVAELSVKG